MKIDELEQIIKILKQNEVNEFEFENDGVRIRLSRGTPVAQSISHHHHQQPMGGYNVEIQPAISGIQTLAPQPAAVAPIEDLSHLFKVESPIVGTFYRKPSPDSPLFVTEGQTVTKGQTLCIIEAMKLMNEIEAPISGKVEKILINDAQVVEFAEVLFLINPNG
jgi:acetyl-CoA carboxylase biotin carboxyl carrier protein